MQALMASKRLRKHIEDLDLVIVLLAVAVLELVLNRLAVPVLRPPGSRTPPMWHRQLDTVGLYIFHLASLLGLGVGVFKAWELTFVRRLFVRTTGAVVGAGALLFFVLAAWGVFLGAPSSLSFHVESSFSFLLLLLGVGMTTRTGDGRVKLGYLALIVPFLFHYYGTFALRVVMSGDVSRGVSLPDRMRDLGQASVGAASLVVAWAFAPRPFWRALTRPGPLAIAGFVAVLVTVVMVRHEDVGMEIASRGLGIELTPGSPRTWLFGFVLAATAAAWTLTTTLIDELAARRQLGIGYALVVVGGYAFAWPVQLVTAAVGAMVIAEATARLPEEQAAHPQPVVRAFPIPDAVWHAYVQALAGALGARTEVTSVDGGERSHLSGRKGEVPFAIDIARSPAGVDAITIAFGDADDKTLRESEPVWTAHARPERLLGAALHPPPPFTPAPTVRTGDPAFDLRFRIHDSGGLTAKLLDDGLRARATAVLDGWVAVWPGTGLVYQVCPGRGAPLDHPIPVTELAFRGGDAAVSTERLVHVFELLHEVAVRALPPGGA